MKLILLVSMCWFGFHAVQSAEHNGNDGKKSTHPLIAFTTHLKPAPYRGQTCRASWATTKSVNMAWIAGQAQATALTGHGPALLKTQIHCQIRIYVNGNAVTVAGVLRLNRPINQKQNTLYAIVLYLYCLVISDVWKNWCFFSIDTNEKHTNTQARKIDFFLGGIISVD